MNSTTSILLILCLSEALVLAVIAAMYLYRQALNLRRKLLSLQVVEDDDMDQALIERIHKYLLLQKNLTEKQVQNLESQNSKEAQVQVAGYEIKSLQTRLIALESEILSIVENAENDQYWPNIAQRYSVLSPHATEVELDNSSESDSILALDAIEEPIAGENSESQLYNEFNETSSPNGQNSYDFQFKDTATEELSRLRDVIGRQFQSIDDLKKTILELESVDSGGGHESNFDVTLKTFKTQLSMMIAEQEQLNMCIEMVEKENLWLHQQIENLSSTHNGNEKNNNEDNLTSKTENEADELVKTQNIVRSLVQTNKEQAQCINILEDEIKILRGKSSEEIDAVPPIAQNHPQEKEYLTKIDDLNEKLGAKISELDLLQADYEMIKQKYNGLIQKAPNASIGNHKV